MKKVYITNCECYRCNCTIDVYRGDWKFDSAPAYSGFCLVCGVFSTIKKEDAKIFDIEEGTLKFIKKIMRSN